MSSQEHSLITQGNTRRARASQSQARLLDKDFLSTLVHKLGHEIGNPLTSIISLATILERFGSIPGSLDAKKSASYARSIIDEAWRVSGLTEKLVLLLSQKKGSPLEIPVNVLFEKALAKLKSRRIVDTSRMQICILSESCPKVWIDLDQGAALIAELLINACDASTPAKGEDFEAEEPTPIELRAAAVGEQVEVSIRSFSKRPCPFELQSIFEPFVTSYGDQRKIGLGLCAAASVVSRADGILEVEEEQVRGGYFFTVRVLLPLKSIDESLKTDKEDISEIKEVGEELPLAASLGLPPELRIVIVDDQETVSSAISKILALTFGERTHLNCRCVDGPAALELLRSGEEFDAFLCDLNLAQTNGRRIFEFLLKVRPQDAKKFAFITGERSRSETELYLKSSRRPYLLKPFEPEELIRLVLELI